MADARGLKENHPTPSNALRNAVELRQAGLRAYERGRMRPTENRAFP
jgi:hypothetical protein